MEDIRKDTCTSEDAELEQELAEVLTAISVITKRLAKKITANQMSKEETDNEEQ